MAPRMAVDFCSQGQPAGFGLLTTKRPHTKLASIKTLIVSCYPFLFSRIDFFHSYGGTVAAEKLAKRYVQKTRVSSTDLIWMFHQRLLSFADFPQQGQISLAIVPTGKRGWTIVVGPRVRSSWATRWKTRIGAIERDLQAAFALKS